MATVVDPILNFTEDGGAGGLLYTLAPGLSWPAGAKSTYSDKPCANALPNPITINANGQPTTGAGAITPVYGTGQYKLILAANGNTYLTPVWTVDNTDLLGSITSFQSISTYGLNANGLIAANANLANGGYLMIDQPITVGNNVTIGANVVLGMPKANGVNITFANSATLTINSPFTPVDFQCFTGTGSVVFAANTLQTPPPPIMWGGGAGGAANANAAAVNIIGTLTPGSATPDVSSMLPVYRTSNNGTITSFANATAGQQFTIIANDANTGLGSTILGSVGTISNSTAIPFVYDGSNTHVVGGVPFPMYKNRLINGEMRVNQRGYTSFTIPANTTTYTIDQWFANVAGANTTILQGPAGISNFKNYLQIAGNSSLTSIVVGQRIESNNVIDLAYAGSQVTLSAYMGAYSNANVTWTASVPTALDNYSNAVSNVANGIWSVTNTYTRYSASFTMPSNAANGLQITFSLTSLPLASTLAFTGVQLEVGSVPTAFEHRPDDMELVRCQRFLPVFFPEVANAIMAFGQANSTTQVNAVLPFNVPARVSPTGVQFYLGYNAVGSANGMTAIGSSLVVANASNGAVTLNSNFVSNASALISVTGFTGLTAGNTYWLGVNGNNLYLFFTGCQL